MTHQITLENGVILETVGKTLIINEHNQALVLTIGEYKEHPDKSYTPDLPGGFVEIGDGESERVGAVREVKEETGIIIRAESPLLVYSKTRFYEKENKSVSKSLYVVRLDHTPDVALSWEHAHYEWIPVKDLLNTKKFAQFFAEAIEYAVTHKLI